MTADEIEQALRVQAVAEGRAELDAVDRFLINMTRILGVEKIAELDAVDRFLINMTRILGVEKTNRFIQTMFAND